jgi:hypothetical protein
MARLLLYGSCVGITSSRMIEKATWEDIPFRVLAGDQHPDHDTIADFRQRHLDLLDDLFQQVLKLCRRAGLAELGHVAVDGTKVKANASKHKAMSYGRMVIREEELRKRTREILEEGIRLDAEEDAKYGKGKRGDELEGDLRFLKVRIARIKEARRALEEEARQKALEEEKKRKKGRRGKAAGAGGAGPAPVDPKAQRNFTDPESKIMKDGATGSFTQAYNVQVAADAASQVVVAYDVVQAANDKRQLLPMLDRVKANMGRYPKEASADTGYLSEEALKGLARRRVDGFVAVQRWRHGTEPPPVRGRCPRGLSRTERMSRKLRTKRGKERYSLRKETVEAVIGQVKEVRGLRQFLLRRLRNVKAEAALWFTGHNLLKLHRVKWGGRRAPLPLG